jgi:hypothetical protein
LIQTSDARVRLVEEAIDDASPSPAGSRAGSPEIDARGETIPAIPSAKAAAKGKRAKTDKPV